MANNLTPIVYDAASREHKPANVGDHLNPAFIAVDTGTGNLLQNRPDNGLRVEAADFVSPTSGNMLTASADGKLYVSMGGGGDDNTLSKEDGNYLRYGNDKGLYVGGEDILSNDTANNLIHTDGSGKKRIILTKEDLENAGIGGGSDVKPDVDQLKIDVRELRTETNTLQRQVEKNTDAITDIKTNLLDLPNMRRDINTNTTDIASLKRDLQDIVIVSTDRDNVLTEGRDDGAYLDKRDIIKVVEDAGITKVDVRDLINSGDPLLTTRNDKLVSGLSLQYNAASGRVDILGVHGNSIASTVIPTAVTMLKSVSIVENPIGQPAGTYIRFQFQLQDGSTTDIYLNVTKLAQFYTAGDGIHITTDGVVSVDPDRIEEIVTDAIEDGDINLVSTDKDNLIEAGSDGRPYLNPEDLPSGISDDAGNGLRLGSDDKPFFPLDYGTL